MGDLDTYWSLDTAIADKQLEDLRKTEEMVIRHYEDTILVLS